VRWADKMNNQNMKNFVGCNMMNKKNFEKTKKSAIKRSENDQQPQQKMWTKNSWMAQDNQPQGQQFRMYLHRQLK
jgi:hypothetical protein